MNDPNATFMLGMDYFDGGNGFQQDIDKALELFQRAAELGSIDAHCNLGDIYFNGNKANYKKGKYRLEIAAMAGHVLARHNLGVLEGKDGNYHRAMKHFLISASAGDDDSVKAVQDGYRNCLVTKDNFEVTLRAHKKSQDEMKSEWRDHAVAVG